MNLKAKLISLALLLFLMISAGFLVACGKTPSLEDRLSEGTYTYEGVIQGGSFNVYQQGTHQLLMEKETLLIQSSTLDLNRYLDEEVIVKGVDAKRIGNAKRVLNVTEVSYPGGNLTGATSAYENDLLGFRFEYPEEWQLEDEGEIVMSFEEVPWVRIKTFNDEADPDAFVAEQEGDTGVAVTIDAQRALRFSDEASFRVYLPNPPRKKVYLVVFNPEGAEDDEDEKELFYQLLESFDLIYRATPKGEKCGGLQRLDCPEDYRCELSDGHKYAEGVCVPLDSAISADSCPYIAPPASCKEYRISEYSKNGCPALFECVTEGSALRSESLNVKNLTATLEKYQDKILPLKSVVLKQYEISPSVSLMAVIYESKGDTYKTLFEFSPSASEFNFIQRGHFKQKGKEWQRLSGKDLQENLEVKIIQAGELDTAETLPVNPDLSEEELEMEKMEYKVPEADNVSRSYENTRKNFTMLYPKNWYYNNFGTVEGYYTVGFAGAEMEEAGDELITLRIEDVARSKGKAGNTVINKRRDANTFYVLEGPSDLKGVMEAMLESVE